MARRSATRVVLSLMLVVSLAGVVSVGATAPSASAATPRRAVVGMPFTGKWAWNVNVNPPYNDVNSSWPGAHAAPGGGDWATDLYAAEGTPVTLNVTSPDGPVTFHWRSSSGCVGSSMMDVYISGVNVGWIYYDHIKGGRGSNTANPQPTNGMTLGRVHYVSGCNPGTHIHIELKNNSSTTHACWFDYGHPGTTVSKGARLGVDGSSNTGLKQKCASDVLGAAPKFTAASPPSTVRLGAAYAYQFAASGSPAPTFSRASGTLPTGLALTSAGRLSGTASASGRFTFQVKATNSVGTATTSNLTITVGTPPAFTSLDQPIIGLVGVPYEFQFAASGSPPPTFSSGGPLPPGLTLSSTGLLSGTPTSRNLSIFTVEASNAFGSTSTPTRVIYVSAGVTAIAHGSVSKCAILDGAASCWGQNFAGALGDGGTEASSNVPVRVVGLASGTTSITAGNLGYCAVVNAAAKCWGFNYLGALGDGGSEVYSNVPVQVAGLTSGVSAIFGNGYGYCAIVAGAAKCWGDNTEGLLGDGGSEAYSNVPVQVKGLTAGVSEVAHGAVAGSTCAIAAGALKCWGDNTDGQLGDGGNEASSNVPVQVSGLTAGVTKAVSTEGGRCAIVSGGVKCWGHGVNVPTQVSRLTSGVTAIASEGDAGYCVVVSGTAKCWGENGAGQLGDGGAETYSSVPVDVTYLQFGVTAIASDGDAGYCALLLGAAACWGENADGQLGDGGSEGSSNVPVQVAGVGLDVTAISGGGYASYCAVVKGAAKCWGSNRSGQLGDGGTEASSNVPVQVVGLDPFA